MDRKSLAKLCKDVSEFASYTSSDCEFIVKYYANYQVVAFRSTKPGYLRRNARFIDVIRDFSVFPAYDKYAGWVQSGYLKSGKEAGNFLLDVLVNDLPVILTGHAAGGAIALMAAVQLQADGFTIKRWCGFGSPKIQLGRKKYNFYQWNYRYMADIVPCMPKIPFYKHNYPVIDLQPDYDRNENWHDNSINNYINVF